MDVYRILIEEHQAIAKMFDEIARTGNLDAELRRKLFSHLSSTLEDHEITEENDFLPALIEASSFSQQADTNAKIKQLIIEIFDDHADFESIAQQISKLPANDDEWLERVNELRDLVREHVRNEQEKLFPAAQKVLDQARAEEIGRQIEERTQRKA